MRVNEDERLRKTGQSTKMCLCVCSSFYGTPLKNGIRLSIKQFSLLIKSSSSKTFDRRELARTIISGAANELKMCFRIFDIFVVIKSKH